MKWLGLFLSSIWLAAMTGGTNAQTAAWHYYDACARSGGSFTAMAECGKRSRAAGCKKENSCGSIGDSVVRYADSLAGSVRRGEIRESEAERRWIEFKLRMEAQMANDINTRAAAEAASAPRFCLFGGSSATCY